MRCQKMDDTRIKTFMEVESKKVQDLTEVLNKERFEKNQTIAELTEENIKLVGELQERDHKHQVLEAKMNEVHLHVSDVTQTLNQYLSDNINIQDQNQELENKVAEQDNYIRELQEQLDESNQMHNQQNDQIEMMRKQIEELVDQLKKKNRQLLDKDQKISQLRTKRKHDKKHSHDLELTVKDLQTRLEENFKRQQQKSHKFQPERNSSKQDNFTSVNQVEPTQWNEEWNNPDIYRTRVSQVSQTNSVSMHHQR